jgi:hypothetical protein
MDVYDKSIATFLPGFRKILPRGMEKAAVFA